MTPTPSKSAVSKLQTPPSGNRWLVWNWPSSPDLHTKGNGPREEEIKRILEKEKAGFYPNGWGFDSIYRPLWARARFLGSAGEGLRCPRKYRILERKRVLYFVPSRKIETVKERIPPGLSKEFQYVLKGGKKAVTLIGVDDPVTKKNDLSGAIRNADPASLKILLAHSPEIFEEAVQSGMDLIFAGHNHGGQIFLVGYLRKVILMDPALEYLEGFYQKGKTLMYVSRGVGDQFLTLSPWGEPEIAFLPFPTTQ